MQNFSASPREMVASLWRNKGLIRNLIHREVVGLSLNLANVNFVNKVAHACAHERCISWNDPAIGITRRQGLTPQLSAKGQATVILDKADLLN